MVSNHGNILSNQSTKDQKQRVVDGDMRSECKKGKKKEKKKGPPGIERGRSLSPFLEDSRSTSVNRIRTLAARLRGG